MKKQMFIYISNFADYFLSVQRILSCLPYLVSRLLSPVSRLKVCLLPHFSHLLAPVSCLLPPFFRLLSPIYCLTSSVSCPMIPVSRLPCCNCCRYNLQYNHLADLTISWSKLADFYNLAILTHLADLAD